MKNLGQQPQVVPGFTWVIGELQEVATGQCGLVAPAFCLLIVGTVALDGVAVVERGQLADAAPLEETGHE